MKCLTLFLIMVLLFGAVTVGVKVLAQENSYFVSVNVDKLYVLHDDQFQVTVVSNASNVEVQFINNGEVEASYTHAANTTRTFTANPSFPYGEYTIKAFYENYTAQTMLTLLDINGWQETSFPYSRIHKNANYTFYGNGTINVQLNNETLNLDLSMIKHLVNLYDLDVEAYYNDMNFRVKFSKNDIVLNLNFAFIHSGCKFIIKGTLDQPRTFSFELENPQRFKRYLGTLRNGNLVFDFSDFRRLGQAFTYSNGVLMVDVPQKFQLDPTLFSDGFESGDTSEWDGSSGTVNVVTGSPYQGVYSASFGTSGANYVYKNVSATGNIFVRVYWNTSSLSATNGRSTSIIRLREANGTVLATLTYEYSSPNYRWSYNIGYGRTANDIITANQYYCLEIEYDADSDTHTFWRNETQLISFSQSISGDVSIVDVGSPAHNYWGATATLDNAVIADSYIGAESEEEANSISLTLTAPANESTVTAYAQTMNYTPTLAGSDNYQNATLYVNGTDVASNQTAITNATVNSISYTYPSNGNYLWDVLVYNSTHGVFSSNGNYTLTVEVPAPTPTPTPTPAPGELTTSEVLGVCIALVIVFMTIPIALIYARKKKNE